MAWKDQLQPGSFRGIPFFVSGITNTIGRRPILHEYPNRNIPFAEDQGRKAREFTVNCHVLGDEYMVDRDALIDAIEKPGAGTLIHHYWGVQTVVVLSARVSEESQEGRIARFIITFAEAGSNVTPVISNDTASLISSVGDLSVVSMIANFGDKFKVSGLSGFVSTNAQTLVNDGLSVLSSLDSFTGDITPITGSISTAILNAEQIATDINAQIEKVVDYIDIKKVWEFGDSLATIVIQDTANRIQEAINQTQIINLYKTSSAIVAGRLLANL